VCERESVRERESESVCEIERECVREREKERQTRTVGERSRKIPMPPEVKSRSATQPHIRLRPSHQKSICLHAIDLRALYGAKLVT